MVNRTSPVAEQVDAILNNLVFKVALVSGTTASTNIAVAGIETGDELSAVIGFDPDNATPADQVQNFSGEASITSDGNIQLGTTNTTGFDLLVLWLDITE
jgi:hypothetical protein